MTEENDNLTPEERERIRNLRRFTPFRYSMRGSTRGPMDTIVFEMPGNFTYPKKDSEADEGTS